MEDVSFDFNGFVNGIKEQKPFLSFHRLNSHQKRTTRKTFTYQKIKVEYIRYINIFIIFANVI